MTKEMLSLKEAQISSNIFLIFLSLNLILCLDNSSILLIKFLGKNLRKEYESDEYIEPIWESDEMYIPPKEVYNISTFLNEWFYNGMYSLTSIGNKYIESYINIENSKLSIEKCNINRIYSTATITTNGNYYKPMNSETYLKKNNKCGNDFFSFIGDLRFKTNINIGEEKGEGLDFYFNEKDKDSPLCGNIGLNLNFDTTNLITQLKQKKYINKYIWTLKYQNEEDGIIILGTEPHFYDNQTYYMSQFCRIKAIPNQSPETSWSFKMNEVRIYDKEKNKIVLSQNKVDFLIDRGLIIGTDEYKNKIDELIFNNLIKEKICFRNTSVFNDYEKGTKDEYYIYYCNSDSFMGNQYTIEKTHYNEFPSLEFYLKESNMTFSLNKEHLFFKIFSRIYFLIIFKKSDSQNNIWKLGEPFISHFQFTFDQEKKELGFYNPKLEKIPNEVYMKNSNSHKSNKNIIQKNWYVFLIVVIIIGLIAVLAYFLGKKLNENRKKRANELNDEDFDYSLNKKNNANDESKENFLIVN